MKLFKAFQHHYVFFVVALFFGLGVYMASSRNARAPIGNEDLGAFFGHNIQLADIGQVISSPNISDISRPSTSRSDVKVFFNNGVLGPALACDQVFPIVRTIEQNSVVPEAALKALFAGITTQEGMEGYFTSLSPVMPLRSISIGNGIAKVDLGPEVVAGVEPGSCRAEAIQAQIMETLRALPGVQQTIILIAGDAKNILNN